MNHLYKYISSLLILTVFFCQAGVCGETATTHKKNEGGVNLKVAPCHTSGMNSSDHTPNKKTNNQSNLIYNQTVDHKCCFKSSIGLDKNDFNPLLVIFTTIIRLDPSSMDTSRETAFSFVKNRDHPPDPPLFIHKSSFLI